MHGSVCRVVSYVILISFFALMGCEVPLPPTPEPEVNTDSDSVGSLSGSFAINTTGAAAYTIPIEVPPGINGMQPNLTLVYNSQAGNGEMGLGWGLVGASSIYRCPTTLAQDGFIDGVDYDNNDQYCLDGQTIKGTMQGDGTKMPKKA